MDEILDDRIESVDGVARRKAAMGDADRLRILYYVYERRDTTVFRSDLPDGDAQPLIDTNLLTSVPCPDGREKLKITKLGADEVQAMMSWFDHP